jgi:sporulation protein YlmC with PRC-barrel domain
MRTTLLSGASVALLSLGAASLPSLADSPSIFADPIGDAPRVQLADSGMIASDTTTTTDATTTMGSDATGTTGSDRTTVDPADTALDADTSDDAAEDAAEEAAEAAEELPTGQLAAEPVQPPETVMVEEVLDADVLDVNGEDVASVHDVLVAADGRLTHVIVSYGGFLGIGTKEVLVPWESVSYNAAQNTLQIPGNEADLEAAPGFVTQEELLDQQEAERAAEATPSPAPSPSGVSVPQEAQTPDPE